MGTEIGLTKFHPLDGARYLRDLGWLADVVNLVAHHLVTADLTVGYNTEYRTAREVPADVRKVLDWLARNMLSVKAVADPDILRALQRAVTRRLDGKKFAPSVARKTRGVLFNALDYAIERKLIEANPLASVKWTAMPKARTLLAGVGALPRSGPRLEAFFGTMYYAGLRPEEAVSLNKRNLVSFPEPV